jgi:hypothetical protein
MKDGTEDDGAVAVFLFPGVAPLSFGLFFFL